MPPATPQPPDASLHDDAIERIARAYRSRWHQGYARGKLRHDPAFAAIAAKTVHRDDGILDIGCGLGLLGMLLRERGFRGAYLGCDIDAAKIDAARDAAARLHPDLRFAPGDAAGGLPEFSGTVVLLDVLHYLDAARQPELLAAAASRVAPGSSLLIRSVVRAHHWRFTATRLLEACAFRSGWLAAPARHFPEFDDIERPLRAAGLEVTHAPLWGHTPFNGWLFEAARP